MTRYARTLERFTAIAACLAACAAFAAPIPTGKSRLEVPVQGESIEVHTYKPERYAGGGILLTLHGLGRNAAGYRDHAIPLAERYGLLVLAPLFDSERFPTRRYQAGGVVRRSNQREPGTFAVEREDTWTGRIFLDIIQAVRRLDASPDAPHYLLGHSGGGQTLSRMAGLMPTGARRIVIANPGTYLWPSRTLRFPYGFGGLPAQLGSDAALQRYLAQPITLLLGTADVKQGPTLSMREGAAEQGINRHTRGLNAYRAAEALARERGWAFNWKLIEVPGVGHSARRMFASDAAASAFADR